MSEAFPPAIKECLEHVLKLEKVIEEHLNFARSWLVGRHVFLKKGQYYKGRHAKIDHIMIHNNKIMALAMVLRVDNPDEVLNSDRTESRQYWSIDELEWL